MSLQEFLGKSVKVDSPINYEQPSSPPTPKIVKKRCENWQPIQEAVLNSDVEKFLELTKHGRNHISL